MKKSAVLFGGFIILLGVVLLPSCLKSTNDSKNTEDRIRVYYERTSAQNRKPSPSVFADHLIKVEEIELGSASLNALSKVVEWNHLSSEYGKLSIGRRYTYDHSPIQVTELPISEGNKIRESALVYSHRNKYLVVLLKISSENSFTKYTVTDVNRNPYYSITLNSSNQIIGTELVRDFSKDQVQVFQSPEVVSSVVVPTCPERYPNSFTSCFQCSVQECGNDALCIIACGLFPASCVAGFTLACTIPVQ